MKKATEILKLPILFIMEGKELAEPKGMIIDPKGEKVSYLVVDDGQWMGGLKLLPFEKIMSIGEDIITARTLSDIITPDDKANVLIQKEVKLFGTRVFTEKGKLLGKIADYSIEEEVGMISQCELDDASIVENFVTLSRDVVIVSAAASAVAKSAQPTVQVEAEIKPEAKAEFTQAPAKEEPEVKAEETFESKQKKFLIGRTANKSIYDSNGVLLVDKGQVIDGAIVDAIMAAGKIIELVTNTRV